MSIERDFSRRLRVLRKGRGLTQQKLAERADLEYKYIQKLESKKPPSPSLRTLAKIAHAFGLHAWQLIKFPRL